MASITVRFCAARDPISAIVRMGCYSFPYSHVEFVLPDGSFVGAHARSGVSHQPQGASTAAVTRSVALPCSDEQADALAGFLQAQIGKPYDYMAIVAIALSSIVGPRNWSRDDAWFCSELVMAALEHAGICSCIIEQANHLSPRDLMIALSTHPEAQWGAVISRTPQKDQ